MHIANSRCSLFIKEIISFEFPLFLVITIINISLEVAPWNHVSHEHNRPLIIGFSIYGEHPRYVL
jgi:hypothetical protein